MARKTTVWLTQSTMSGSKSSQTLLNRRAALTRLVLGVLSVRVPWSSAAFAAVPPTPCVLTPRQTEGPYFVDERLHRNDIRSDPADGSLRPGTPLTLKLAVREAAKDRCTPIVGATVDIWHCDAQGIYSDVIDPGFNAKGKKFLRGYQLTDETGIVQFTTIYPGWYSGRAVHIHFKVRLPRSSSEITSQLYFNDAITDRVHKRAPYNSKGDRDLRNRDDGIFRQGGTQLLVILNELQNGYTGSFDIGIRAA